MDHKLAGKEPRFVKVKLLQTLERGDQTFKPDEEVDVREDQAKALIERKAAKLP